MSKKLAEGIDAPRARREGRPRRVHERPRRRRALARDAGAASAAAGKQVTALLTDMDAPLGRTVGNALEIARRSRCCGRRPGRPRRAARVALGAEMLVLGGVAGTPPRRGARSSGHRRRARRSRCSAQIVGRRAAIRAVDDPLPPAAGPAHARGARAARGFVAAIDTEALGIAAIALGAGRARTRTGSTPPWASIQKKVGDNVEAGEPLARSTTGAAGPRRRSRWPSACGGHTRSGPSPSHPSPSSSSGSLAGAGSPPPSRFGGPMR